MQEVETKTFMNQGQVCSKPNGFKFMSSEPAPVTGFYVHPESGLLCYREYESYRTRWRNQKKEPTDIPMPGNEAWFYRQIDGLWFACLVVMRKDYFGRDKKVILCKRSANRKEIAWIKTQIGIK